MLNSYFQSDKPQVVGLPSVSYCADELHLSANYFGDLIQKETGRKPTEYIQLKVMDLAKEKILNRGRFIGEIAFEPGLKYPQHFTRLSRKQPVVAE